MQSTPSAASSAVPSSAASATPFLRPASAPTGFGPEASDSGTRESRSADAWRGDAGILGSAQAAGWMSGWGGRTPRGKGPAAAAAREEQGRRGGSVPGAGAQVSKIWTHKKIKIILIDGQDLLRSWMEPHDVWGWFFLPLYKRVRRMRELCLS
jgi:hypothetical protein